MISNDLVADACDGAAGLKREPSALGRLICSRLGACPDDLGIAAGRGGPRRGCPRRDRRRDDLEGCGDQAPSGGSAASEPAGAGLLASVDLPASAGCSMGLAAGAPAGGKTDGSRGDSAVTGAAGARARSTAPPATAASWQRTWRPGPPARRAAADCPAISNRRRSGLRRSGRRFHRGEIRSQRSGRLGPRFQFVKVRHRRHEVGIRAEQRIAAPLGRLVAWYGSRCDRRLRGRRRFRQ